MRPTVRLIVAIWLALLGTLGTFAHFQVQREREQLEAELQRRAALLGESLREATALRTGSAKQAQALLKKFARDDRAIAVFDRFGSPVATAPGAASRLPSPIPEVTAAIAGAEVHRGVRVLDGRSTYVYATPIQDDDEVKGALVVLLDASHVDAAGAASWQYHAIRFVVAALGVSLITLLIVRMTFTRPLSEIAAWTRTLKTGPPLPPPGSGDARLFGPLALEVSTIARSLHRAQAAAEQEAALRLAGEAVWTEERLKQFVRARFGNQPLFIVTNRQPLSHVRQGRSVVAQTPASGVVTALEPVARACGAVWIAHGSGDADATVTDATGRLALPADDPKYTLRRVWLSTQEEDGYYYGFANEGLWPLCHVVHARPLFRPEDWHQYAAVNQKFADALLEEMSDAERPVVLVQDYHFALLPALVKRQRPDARIGIFWHIPWPNFEAFGICPWQSEILEGMLGADLIGFHTQYHCNNFLETVERALEVRVDSDHFAVVRGRRVTHVKPFPISVPPEFVDVVPSVSRQELLARLGIRAEFVGVGVERLDYTKGLLERFEALRRFFERYPEYLGRLVFIQCAAPSRGRIARYGELQADVRRAVEELNRALGTRDWQPIVYVDRHIDRPEIWPLYRHADFCMVTSLHDGMNLVAKEFVSVRDDGDGVLILSRFTGAARELTDALLVNPYDVNATADAIRAAVEMPEDERRRRMLGMRRVVGEHNIYRWAGLLLDEMSRVQRPPSTADGGQLSTVAPATSFDAAVNPHALRERIPGGSP